jgi:hypothetical protein
MSTGGRLVEAITTHDPQSLRGLFADSVDFKAVTPRRFWEASTSDEAVDVILGHWFEESDHIDSATHDEGSVADTQRVSYRFEISNADGPQVVEQQAYYRTTDGRIDYLRVVCSGFRPAR